MHMINDKNIVQKQYENASNLNTRISIHEKYSVNRQGFSNWIASHYSISEGSRILELGCGTGDLWKQNTALIERCSELVLTDISEEMLQTARRNVGEHAKVTYNVVDIQKIPYASGSFDFVIANMMLYHVPDLKRGLSEVKRVLKKDGRFTCATYGEHGIVEFIAGLLKPYGAEEKLNKNFTLQNGGQILGEFFSSVKMLEYSDSLEVTDPEDMLDYVYSLTGMTGIGSISRDVLKSVLQQNMVDGILSVPKEYGMFVCR